MGIIFGRTYSISHWMSWNNAHSSVIESLVVELVVWRGRSLTRMSIECGMNHHNFLNLRLIAVAFYSKEVLCFHVICALGIISTRKLELESV